MTDHRPGQLPVRRDRRALLAVTTGGGAVLGASRAITVAAGLDGISGRD